ncbi:MAG TPA: FUSC family protein, partial [Bdellovibrio sp.]|nr:FUSC family protein [Bdellovibrio sp.]
LGELICYIFREDLNRAYWVPMTIVIVLKPDYGSTVRRSFLRILGTLVGLILATALFHVLPENAAAEISLIVLFTFLTRWVGSANYGIFAMCVGALVVLLIAMTGVAPRDVMWARGLNTFIGGAIALFVSWCWPTSEKLQMSEVIAHMLETYLEYFRAITKTLVGESRDASEMDRLRQTARVARANFLASLERYTQERRARFDDLKVISAVTVASNRFAHAMMAVEAGSSQDISLEQGKAFQSFAGSVEKDLQLLCEYLCVREVSAREFPDLRADYVLFAESKAHNGENFLYEEADRMTNSLSTLTEQILRRKIQRPITAS